MEPPSFQPHKLVVLDDNLCRGRCPAEKFPIDGMLPPTEPAESLGPGRRPVALLEEACTSTVCIPTADVAPGNGPGSHEPVPENLVALHPSCWGWWTDCCRPDHYRLYTGLPAHGPSLRFSCGLGSAHTALPDAFSGYHFVRVLWADYQRALGLGAGGTSSQALPTLARCWPVR